MEDTDHHPHYDVNSDEEQRASILGHPPSINAGDRDNMKDQNAISRFISQYHKLIIICLIVLFLVTTLCLVGFLLWTAKVWPFHNRGGDDDDDDDKKRSTKGLNIIFMVGDGFGPASQTFARIATTRSTTESQRYQHIIVKDGKHRQNNEGDHLILDTLLSGTVRTYSHDSFVTDSAAGATAYTCALKTYNGAIGVDPEGKPCATLMEAAMLRGMRTGIVVTTNITDATPAAFSAHATHRSQQSKIAYQQIVDMARLNKKDKWGVDVMFGGGRCFFQPSSAPSPGAVSCRDDDRDVYGMAQRQYGYHVAETRQQMNALNSLPALGLFSNVEMKYNLDRSIEDEESETEPTLAEMTQKALQLLKANTKKDQGFFLMVEGSRIDHAGHANDIAAHLREVQAYNAAIKVAVDFAKKDGNTLIISTADHETGGLTLGRCVDKNCPYLYNPDFVSGIKGSTGRIASQILERSDTESVEDLMKRFGIPNLTANERYMIFNTNRTSNHLSNIMLGVDEVINRRAHIGWSSLAHTGIDINLYAYGPFQHLFRGNLENTDVGAKVAELFDFDLEEITKKLQPSE